MTLCILCGLNESPGERQACPFCAVRRFLGWDEAVDQLEQAYLQECKRAAEERLREAMDR